MGLIDFVKDVGHKLGLEHGGAQPAAQHAAPQSAAQRAPQAPAQPPAAPAQPSAADQDRQKAAALFQRLEQLGLATGDDVSVRVDGAKATLSGKVPSQDVKEKIVLVVGNSQGIAQVDDQLQAPPAQAEATYYDVRSGDTLSKIAKQFYGDANRYPEIFEANRPMLKSPDEIYPGQKLRIPAAQTVHA
jgi:nucleoid-associated protein YgaU